MARTFSEARRELQAELNARGVNPAHYGFVPKSNPRELHLIGGGMKRTVITIKRMDGETEDMARNRLLCELHSALGGH
jgi:hypothetical protein